MPRFTQIGIDLTGPLAILSTILEPKATRRARQQLELLKDIVDIRQRIGYQPELEKQILSQSFYRSGLLRYLAFPSERELEPLFIKPETMRLERLPSGRIRTRYEPLTELPPPHIPPLIPPQEREEVERIASEIFANEPEAAQAFKQAYAYNRVVGTAPPQEFLRYNAIGLISSEMQRLKDELSKKSRHPLFREYEVLPGETTEQAQDRYIREQTKHKYPRAYAIFEDFHLLNEARREELESRVEARKEREIRAKAELELKRYREQWRRELEERKLTLREKAMKAKDQNELRKLAFQEYTLHMKMLQERRKRQDDITREYLKQGFQVSGYYNAFGDDYYDGYNPYMTFNQWLLSPDGAYWLEMGVTPFTATPPPAISGQPQPGVTPPSQQRTQPQLSPQEERLRKKYGFSP